MRFALRTAAPFAFLLLSSPTALADGSCITGTEEVLKDVCSDFSRPEGGIQGDAGVQPAARACRGYYKAILDALDHYCQYKNRENGFAQRAQAQQQSQGANAGKSNVSQTDVAALTAEGRKIHSDFAAVGEKDIRVINSAHDDYKLALHNLLRTAKVNMSAERRCDGVNAPFASKVPGFVLSALVGKTGPEAWESYSSMVPNLSQEIQKARAAAAQEGAISNQTSRSGVNAGAVTNPGDTSRPLPLADAGQAPDHVTSQAYVAGKVGGTYVIGWGVEKYLAPLEHAAHAAHAAKLGPVVGKILVAEVAAPAELLIKALVYRKLDWPTLVITGITVATSAPVGAAAAAAFYIVKSEVEAAREYRSWAIPQIEHNRNATAQQLREGFCHRQPAAAHH